MTNYFLLDSLTNNLLGWMITIVGVMLAVTIGLLLEKLLIDVFFMIGDAFVWLLKRIFRRKKIVAENVWGIGSSASTNSSRRQTFEAAVVAQKRMNKAVDELIESVKDAKRSAL